jgi:hypothetical protein
VLQSERAPESKYHLQPWNPVASAKMAHLRLEGTADLGSAGTMKAELIDLGLAAGDYLPCPQLEQRSRTERVARVRSSQCGVDFV